MTNLEKIQKLLSGEHQNLIKELNVTQEIDFENVMREISDGSDWCVYNGWSNGAAGKYPVIRAFTGLATEGDVNRDIELTISACGKVATSRLGDYSEECGQEVKALVENWLNEEPKGNGQ